MTKLVLTESVRLYPDKVQEKYFHQACSLSTHFYNKALTWDKEIRESTGRFADQKMLLRLFKEYKDTLEFDGASSYKVETHTMRDGIFRYLDARKRFFSKVGGFPKFQTNKGKNKKSFHVREDKLIFVDGTNKVRVPGLFRLPTPRKNNVRFAVSHMRVLYPKVQSARVVFDGKYWFLRYSVYVDVLPEEYYASQWG